MRLLGLVRMQCNLLFDNRHALDIIDDLVSNYTSTPMLDHGPTKLILVPDRLTGNQLVAYLTNKGNNMLLNDLIIITFEQLAYWILGEEHKILDPELRKIIATTCVFKGTDRVSLNIQKCLEGVEEKEKSPIIENLLSELDEFCALKSPLFRTSKKTDLFFKSRIALLDPILKQRAENVLQFFNELEKQCIQQMITVGLSNQTCFTRAHLISTACKKLSTTTLSNYPKIQNIEDVFVIGIGIFETDLLDFLSQLMLQVKKTTISASEKISNQLSTRLEGVLGSKFPTKPIFIKKPTSISKMTTTVMLPDRRREAEFAALKCIEILKEKKKNSDENKYKPSDILLVARLAGDYLPYFENVFNEYGLPAFMQIRVSMIFTPVYRLIESVLDLLVKCKNGSKIRARDISKPLRLGFPFKIKSKAGRTYDKALDDKQFLVVESILEFRESYDGANSLDQWISNLEGIKKEREKDPKKNPGYAYDPPIELLQWIKNVSDTPSIQHLTTLVERFINCYGTQEEYPVLGFVSQSRFRLTKEHISSEASRIVSDLYALSGHNEKVAAARKELDSTSKKDETWSNIRTAFVGVIGSDTYGRVYRDADAILFVDAGISHFIDADRRIILGLTNDQFPRKLKEPFLLFMELRDILNDLGTGSFLTNNDNHREVEKYLYETALGRKKDQTITMNYLDDRGHRQHWSVFVPEDEDEPDIWPHELRVELSGFMEKKLKKKTHCVSTAIFDYLRQSRLEKDTDYDDGLKGLQNKYTKSTELDQEVEAIITSTKTMKERVIDGKFKPKLSVGPSEVVGSIFNTDKEPMSWELDLYMYCPSMYYFYTFYYLLPNKEWIAQSLGVNDFLKFKPAFKRDYRLHEIPPPVWRTQYSTVGTNWIQSKIGDMKASAPDMKGSEIKVKEWVPEIEDLKISPAEKRALRELLDYLSKQKDTFQFRHEEYSDSKKFIHPFLYYKNNNNQINVYKLGPRDPFRFTVLCRDHYQAHRLGVTVSKYFAFKDSSDKLIPSNVMIDAVSSFKSFQEGFHYNLENGRVSSCEKVCDMCPYSTLCGDWRF